MTYFWNLSKGLKFGQKLLFFWRVRQPFPRAFLTTRIPYCFPRFHAVMCKNGLLISYAKQLRRIVRAASEDGAGSKIYVDGPDAPSIHFDDFKKQIQDDLEKKKAKEILREDRGGAGMAMMVGGESDGTYIEIDTSMPVGARTRIGGQVYQLRDDGKLHYEEKK